MSESNTQRTESGIKNDCSESGSGDACDTENPSVGHLSTEKEDRSSTGGLPRPAYVGHNPPH